MKNSNSKEETSPLYSLFDSSREEYKNENMFVKISICFERSEDLVGLDNIHRRVEDDVRLNKQSSKEMKKRLDTFLYFFRLFPFVG